MYCGWIALILIAQVVSVVEGSGVIETNFIEFENFEGRRFDGKCCDANNYWWSSDKTCSDECDHNFVLCMGNATDSSSMSACEFGKKKIDTVGGNKIIFNGNVGEFDNPIKFRFTQWPGVAKLKIDVRDKDGEGFDFVDRYEYQYNIRDLSRETETTTESLKLKGTRTRIDMELKVFCDINHYGTDCGTFCEETDDHTGHYRCDPATGDKICMSGWIGDKCLKNFDDCEGNRCYNGSTCVDGLNSYRCLCQPGRTGHTCHGEINECASRPCKNDGICMVTKDSFHCECGPGFSGPTCQFEIEECTCLNGGECNDELTSAICSCPPGFEGSMCELDVNECEVSLNICGDNGWCINMPGNYTCLCTDGYVGINCEIEINECDRVETPCFNGGTCIDKIGRYVCECAQGYTGETCNIDIFECESSPCVNSGVCMDTINGYICKCPIGYIGVHCEIQSTTSATTTSSNTPLLTSTTSSYVTIDDIETSTHPFSIPLLEDLTDEHHEKSTIQTEYTPYDSLSDKTDLLDGRAYSQAMDSISSPTTSSSSPVFTSTTSSYVTLDATETSSQLFPISSPQEFSDRPKYESTSEHEMTSEFEVIFSDIMPTPESVTFADALDKDLGTVKFTGFKSLPSRALTGVSDSPISTRPLSHTGDNVLARSTTSTSSSDNLRTASSVFNRYFEYSTTKTPVISAKTDKDKYALDDSQTTSHTETFRIDKIETMSMLQTSSADQLELTSDSLPELATISEDGETLITDYTPSFVDNTTHMFSTTSLLQTQRSMDAQFVSMTYDPQIKMTTSAAIFMLSENQSRYSCCEKMFPITPPPPPFPKFILLSSRGKHFMVSEAQTLNTSLYDIQITTERPDLLLSDMSSLISSTKLFDPGFNDISVTDQSISASTTSSNTLLHTSTTSSYVTIDDFETSTHPFSIPLLEDFTDEHHEKSTIQTEFTSYDSLSDKTDLLDGRAYSQAMDSTSSPVTSSSSPVFTSTTSLYVTLDATETSSQLFPISSPQEFSDRPKYESTSEHEMTSEFEVKFSDIMPTPESVTFADALDKDLETVKFTGFKSLPSRALTGVSDSPISTRPLSHTGDNVLARSTTSTSSSDNLRTASSVFNRYFEYSTTKTPVISAKTDKDKYALDDSQTTSHTETFRIDKIETMSMLLTSSADQLELTSDSLPELATISEDGETPVTDQQFIYTPSFVDNTTHMFSTTSLLQTQRSMNAQFVSMPYDPQIKMTTSAAIFMLSENQSRYSCCEKMFPITPPPPPFPKFILLSSRGKHFMVSEAQTLNTSLYDVQLTTERPDLLSGDMSSLISSTKLFDPGFNDISVTDQSMSASTDSAIELATVVQKTTLKPPADRPNIIRTDIPTDSTVESTETLFDLKTSSDTEESRLILTPVTKDSGISYTNEHMDGTHEPSKSGTLTHQIDLITNRTVSPRQEYSASLTYTNAVSDFNFLSMSVVHSVTPDVLSFRTTTNLDDKLLFPENDMTAKCCENMFPITPPPPPLPRFMISSNIEKYASVSELPIYSSLSHVHFTTENISHSSSDTYSPVSSTESFDSVFNITSFDVQSSSLPLSESTLKTAPDVTLVMPTTYDKVNITRPYRPTFSISNQSLQSTTTLNNLNRSADNIYHTDGTPGHLISVTKSMFISDMSTKSSRQSEFSVNGTSKDLIDMIKNQTVSPQEEYSSSLSVVEKGTKDTSSDVLTNLTYMFTSHIPKNISFPTDLPLIDDGLTTLKIQTEYDGSTKSTKTVHPLLSTFSNFTNVSEATSSFHDVARTEDSLISTNAFLDKVKEIKTSSVRQPVKLDTHKTTVDLFLSSAQDKKYTSEKNLKLNSSKQNIPAFHITSTVSSENLFNISSDHTLYTTHSPEDVVTENFSVESKMSDKESGKGTKSATITEINKVFPNEENVDNVMTIAEQTSNYYMATQKSTLKRVIDSDRHKHKEPTQGRANLTTTFALISSQHDSLQEKSTPSLPAPEARTNFFELLATTNTIEYMSEDNKKSNFSKDLKVVTNQDTPFHTQALSSNSLSTKFSAVSLPSSPVTRDYKMGTDTSSSHDVSIKTSTHSSIHGSTDVTFREFVDLTTMSPFETMSSKDHLFLEAITAQQLTKKSLIKSFSSKGLKTTDSWKPKSPKPSFDNRQSLATDISIASEPLTPVTIDVISDDKHISTDRISLTTSPTVARSDPTFDEYGSTYSTTYEYTSSDDFLTTDTAALEHTANQYSNQPDLSKGTNSAPITGLELKEETTSITKVFSDESVTIPTVMEMIPNTETASSPLQAETNGAFQDLSTQSKDLSSSVSLESTASSTDGTSHVHSTLLSDKLVGRKQPAPHLPVLHSTAARKETKLPEFSESNTAHKIHETHLTTAADLSHSSTSVQTSVLPLWESSKNDTIVVPSYKPTTRKRMVTSDKSNLTTSGTPNAYFTKHTQSTSHIRLKFTDMTIDKYVSPTALKKEFLATTQSSQSVNTDIKTPTKGITRNPNISLGEILIKMSRGTQQRSQLFTTRSGVKSSFTTVANRTRPSTIVYTYPTVTYKRSFIRHRIDLTSNNTYPHPRKEIYEYDRNTTLAKGKARMTMKRIRVTVIRTVSSAIEAGKKVVLQTYQRVKNITTRIRVATYDRSRQLLKLALDRVEALFKYCEDGINHFVVKPLLDTKEFVKERFNNAYVRLGEVFRRGKLIFKSTAEDVREETQTYFETLANYYTGVYRQYSEEVRDIFESLKIPDS